MRWSACFAPLLLLFAACGQKTDHPALAAGCDPTVMKCVHSSPPAGSGSGNEAGASGSGEEVTTLAGEVLVLGEDSFDPGIGLSSPAEVTATGASGARVKATYDGMSFQLEGALKEAANWFLVTPEAKSAMVPTLLPVDTRSTTTVSVGVVSSVVMDTIFLSLNTDRSLERAQVALRVVDAKGRSVVGAHATASATPEILAYRQAGLWLRDNSGTDLATDDSGLLLLGNLQAGTALSTLRITLSGASSARVDVEIVAGATTLVTAVVAAK
jgi:hypothetical protein